MDAHAQLSDNINSINVHKDGEKEMRREMSCGFGSKVLNYLRGYGDRVKTVRESKRQLYCA